MDFLKELLEFTGVLGCGRFLSDVRFYVAIGAALLFYGVLALFVTPHPCLPHSPWFFAFQFFCVAFPEEFFFRGFLIPVIGARVRFSVFGVSGANLISAGIFSVVHLFTHPPLWALGVFVPGVIFGYFRERHNSLWPPVILHFLYNVGYFLLF